MLIGSRSTPPTSLGSPLFVDTNANFQNDIFRSDFVLEDSPILNFWIILGVIRAYLWLRGATAPPLAESVEHHGCYPWCAPGATYVAAGYMGGGTFHGVGSNERHGLVTPRGVT